MCCLQLCRTVFHLCSLAPMSTESESTSCEPSGPKSSPIKPGRPRTSPVWEHFVYDVSKDKSICQMCVVEGDADSAATLEGRLCGVEVSGKYSTNLKAHLKAVHALTYDAVVQKEAANKIERERTGVLNLCQLCSSCWCLSPL